MLEKTREAAALPSWPVASVSSPPREGRKEANCERAGHPRVVAVGRRKTAIQARVGWIRKCMQRRQRRPRADGGGAADGRLESGRNYREQDDLEHGEQQDGRPRTPGESGWRACHGCRGHAGAGDVEEKDAPMVPKRRSIAIGSRPPKIALQISPTRGPTTRAFVSKPRSRHGGRHPGGPCPRRVRPPS